MSGSASTDTVLAWLRVLHRPPSPRQRWLLFPHGGAGAGTFGGWVRRVRTDPALAGVAASVEMIAIQYPGREDRFRDPGTLDLTSMIVRIAGELRVAARAGSGGHDQEGSELLPTLLYGHSMGALIAWEMCARLGAAPWWRPVALVASGHEAPHHLRQGTFHRRSDAALLAELRRLGGADLDALGDAELVTHVLEILREDYRLVETHQRPRPVRLDVPIWAWAGEDDPDLDERELSSWSEVTHDFRGTSRYPGTHLYSEEGSGAVLLALAAVGAAAG